MKKYIGMDVHCKQTTFVAQTETADVVGQGRVETSRGGFEEMLEAVEAEHGTKVGMESGIQATWVSRLLRELGRGRVIM